MNFRIVDGENDYEEKYAKFEELYCDSEMNIKDICSSLHLTNRMYRKMRQEVVNKTGYKRPVFKKVSFAEDKYIHRTEADHFEIRKRIDGKQISFGTFETMSIARNVRDFLEMNNWDSELIPFVKEQYPIPSFPDNFKKYNEFKKEFLDGTCVRDLRTMFDLSQHNYYLLSRKVRDECGLKRKPRKVSV